MLAMQSAKHDRSMPAGRSVGSWQAPVADAACCCVPAHRTHVHPDACRVSVHVEEQTNTLRAQLLRSEQEKELMRVKLEEERLEREKAQKQVGTGLRPHHGRLQTNSCHKPGHGMRRVPYHAKPDAPDGCRPDACLASLVLAVC